MKNMFLIKKSIKWSLALQRIFSYFLLIVFYPCIFIILYSIYRYRIVDMKSVRKEFQNICSKINGPLLICSNHHTFIDPVILIWAFGSFWYYLFHYDRFVWNFPGSRYSQKHWLYQLFFFMSKCIPVHRNVYNREIKTTMEKMIYLLTSQDTLLIFPEGKRSTTGKIDKQKFTKGVGRLLNEINHLPVLCVYLNNESGKGCGFPEKGEKFNIAIKLIYPEKTKNEGPEAINEYSSQIINTLCSIEEKILAMSDLN